MWSIYYKVNGKGQYKNYMDGTYTEMKKASDDLINRATSKGFKMVKRSYGTGGVKLTYSDGKTSVQIVYIEADVDREWLATYDKWQAQREAKENKAA